MPTPTPAVLAQMLGAQAPDDQQDADQPIDTDGEDGDSNADASDQESTPFEKLPKYWQKKIDRYRNDNRTLRASKKEPAVAPKDDLEAAEAKGRAAARDEYGARLAGAEVKARLAAVVPAESLDDFVSKLNLSTYVDEGEVNTDSIDDLVETVTRLLGNTRKPATKTDHGRSGAGPKNSDEELHRVIRGF